MLLRYCYLDQQLCFALFLFCFPFFYGSYDLICPVSSQWHKRVNGYCDAGKHYMCLYDDNNASYMETCEESPDFQPAGSRTIRVGGLDRKECKKTRYQPFKYWTNHSSGCELEKSLCNEQGQIVHNNGSTKTDRTCQCDYTRGYIYLIPPKHKCYCEPAEEDCTCILKSCPVKHFLNPDYICIQTTDLTGDFKCSGIQYSSPQPPTVEIVNGQEKQFPRTGYRRLEQFVILACSIVLLLFSGFLVMFLWLMDPVQSIVQLEDDDDCFKYNTGITDPKLIRIAEWESRNKNFVMSESVLAVMHHLEKTNNVLVTGPTGIGKSTILQHIAIFYRDFHNFEILICNRPLELEQLCTRERKLVIVIDDIGGQYAAVQSEMDEWHQMHPLINKLLIQGNTKIIASCNEQVFQDRMFKRSMLFSKDSFDLSPLQHSLSLEDKVKIANQYLPENIINKVNLSNNKYPFLPLLCFLAKDMSEHDAVDMLTCPVDHYIRELERFWNTDKLTSFSLFLFVLNHGLVDRSTLINLDKELTDMIMKTCRTFQIDYDQHLNRSILSKFQFLTGKYLRRNGQVFTTIHETIYGIVCHYFGKKVQQDLIENANSNVIRDRTQFKSLTNGNDSTFCIVIEEDNEKKYFDRILRSRNIEDILCNSQMCFLGYRQKLIKHLENNLDNNCLKTIFNSNVKGNMLPLHIVCKKGYADMLMFIMKFITNINNDEFPYVFEACNHGNIEIVTLLVENGADINKSCKTTGITPIMVACQDKNYELIDLLITKYADIYKEAHNGLNALVAAFMDGNTRLIDMFVQKDVDLNKTSGSGWTPLMKACENGHTELVKYLLERGVNVNLADYNKQTALMKACAGKFVEIIIQLLSKGADVAQADNNGWTPLLKACQLGTTYIAEILIERNSDVNHADSEGNTPLKKACKYGHIEIVELLLTNGSEVNKISAKGGFSPFLAACEAGHEDISHVLAPLVTDVNEGDHSGCTPLIVACRKGHLNIVKMLIKMKVDIRKADENGWSPLMNACDCKAGNYEIVELLIQHGADVNRQDIEGWTTLSKACRHGHEKIAQLLLDNKADVNIVSKTGWTSFMLACETSNLNLDFIQLLVEKGANINLGNKSGWNALLSACKRGHYDLVTFLLNQNVDVNIANRSGVNSVMVACENGHSKIVDLLHKHGANLNAVDSNEKNAVMFAYQGCNKEIVYSLVLRGVEINQQDSDGWTILMKAAKDGDNPIINFLLENNANSDRCDTDGQSCVTKASKGGYKSTVELLLEKGAQCDTIDKKGWTPLMWASEGGHLGVAQILINHGANVNHVAYEPKQWTALITASNRGYTDIVKVLMANGALSSE